MSGFYWYDRTPTVISVGAVTTYMNFPPLWREMLCNSAGEWATRVGAEQTITAEAAMLALPVGLLVAMILYVNEIPDRAGDAKAGKRTLPVRWSKAATIRGFDVSAGASFAIVAAGGMANLWGALFMGVLLNFLSLRGYLGSYDDAVFGAILIFIMLFAPNGLLRKDLFAVILNWLKRQAKKKGAEA